MVNRKTASALTVAALLACAIPTQSVASLLFQAPVLGQAAPSFSVPDSVAKGTQVKIASSSDNMTTISRALGQGFEKQYAGKVNITTNDSNAAIQAVLNGNADLAAISRPLTEAEKEKKLIAVPVRREKIAVVVGKDNAFSQSITGSQFAQIFRGEIRDWSAVGGSAGPIKVIDRPDTSETRQALKPYPVFTTAEFKTGDTATQLSEDSTAALAKALGKDGIGYMLVSELEGQPDIKAIQLHQTLPDDPRYPFSQPYSFVYAGGASPAVAAFLGYATGNPGQSVLNNANLSGYAISPGAGATRGAGGNTAAGAPADGAASSDTEGNGNAANADNTNGNSSAEGSASGSANGAAVDGAADTTQGNVAIGEDGTVITDGVDGTDANDLDGVGGEANQLLAGRGRWWWLLLPLAGLGLLIWAAAKRSKDEETGYAVNTGSTGGVADDRIRSSYRGNNLPKTGLGSGLDAVEADGISTSVEDTGDAVGTVGSVGLGKAAASGVALVGGVAAAGAGLAGRIKNKAGDVTTGDVATGDVTMDLGNISDSDQRSEQSSIDDMKESLHSDLGNVRSGVQSSVPGGTNNITGAAQGSIDRLQGRIDGDQTKLQGSIQGGIDGVKSTSREGMGLTQDGLNSDRTHLQVGIDSNKHPLQSVTHSATEKGSSWLERAKQRINEATEQATDKASAIKDDIKDTTKQ